MSTILRPNIGADIELFVSKKARKHYRVIGATTIIKKGDTYQNTKITEDGIQLEIKPVYKACREEFIESIRNLMRGLSQMEKEEDVRILLDDVHIIKDTVFKKIPECDKELGCTPDINAYTGQVNRIDNKWKNNPLRTCGGHLHFGVSSLQMAVKHKTPVSIYPLCGLFSKSQINIKVVFYKTQSDLNHYRSPEEKEYSINPINIHEFPFGTLMSLKPENIVSFGNSCNPETPGKYFLLNTIDKVFKIRIFTDKNGILLALLNPLDTVKMIDLFTAIPAVLLDSGKKGRERREVYGKSGAFRYTPYGFEYRTLSNFWLCDPALTSLMTGLARFAINIMGGYLYKTKTHLDEAGIRAWEWINEKDNIYKLRYAIDYNHFNTAKEIYTSIIVPILNELSNEDFPYVPLSSIVQRRIFHNICMNKDGYKSTFSKENFIQSWEAYKWNGWYKYSDLTPTKNLEKYKNDDKRWEKYKKSNKG